MRPYISMRGSVCPLVRPSVCLSVSNKIITRSEKTMFFNKKKSLQKLSKVWKILSGSILASLQNGLLVSRSGCLLRSLEIQWKSNFFHKSKLEEASQTISIGQSFYQSWWRIVFLMDLVQSNSSIRHIITTSTGVAGSLVVVAAVALVLDAIRRY